MPALNFWSLLENSMKFYFKTLALCFSETIEDIKTLSALFEIHLTVVLKMYFKLLNMCSVFLPGRHISIQVEMTGRKESVSQIIRPSGRGKQQKAVLIFCLQPLHFLHISVSLLCSIQDYKLQREANLRGSMHAFLFFLHSTLEWA